MFLYFCFLFLVIIVPAKFQTICHQLIQHTATLFQLPLHSLVSRLQESSTGSSTTNTNCLPLHISLSKVTTLRYHQISSFIQLLTINLQKDKLVKFPLRLSQPCVLINETRSRSFIGLAEEHSLHHSMLPSTLYSTNFTFVSFTKLISCIDNTLQEYGKPIYYQPAVIHVTTATTEGDISTTAEKHTLPVVYAPTPMNSSPSASSRAVENYFLQFTKLDRLEREKLEKEDKELEESIRNYTPYMIYPSSSSLPDTDTTFRPTIDMFVYEICCKIGNKIYKFPIQTNI